MEDVATVPQIIHSVSSVLDKSMSSNDPQCKKHRTNFLLKIGANPESACVVRLEYEGGDYRRYHTVDRKHIGQGTAKESVLISDALLTKEKGITLFLPLADCVGAVIWDMGHTALMVSHLGRHNLEQNGGAESIEYFIKQSGVAASDLFVYLSPAAGKDAYPVHSLEGKGLHEVAFEQLLSAGVNPANIQVDARDTTKDLTLFSHSEFLKGNRENDGRFAVFAMLEE